MSRKKSVGARPPKERPSCTRPWWPPCRRARSKEIKSLIVDSVAKVGEAVTQLDTATQKNAALVERSTPAADSLKQQATQLNAVVQRFASDT